MTFPENPYEFEDNKENKNKMVAPSQEELEFQRRHDEEIRRKRRLDPRTAAGWDNIHGGDAERNQTSWGINYHYPESNSLLNETVPKFGEEHELRKAKTEKTLKLISQQPGFVGKSGFDRIDERINGLESMMERIIANQELILQYVNIPRKGTHEV